MSDNMTWVDFSEKVFGLVWLERRSPSMYDADNFAPPYDDALRLLQKGSKEDVLKSVNDKFIQNAIHSVSHLNGLGDEKAFDDNLIKSANAYKLGKILEKHGKKLQENADIDLVDISGQMQSFVAKQYMGLRLASEIDYEKFEPFMKSGWEIYDNLFGGIPQAGLIVAFGETGVGKSFWLSKLLKEFLTEHKNKTGAIYTLEMTSEEYLQRSIGMYPELKEFRPRFYVSGEVRRGGMAQVMAECASKQVNIVGIDFVDWIVSDFSESAYATVYQQCVEMSRLLKIPVIMMAQPNREGVKYSKFLTKFDLRYTGMAENSAWQLIALQKANAFDMEDDKYPLEDNDMFYMINLKQRGGWPKQQGPGAIILENNPRRLWDGKLYQNKPILWTPNSGKSSIGKKKSKD